MQNELFLSAFLGSALLIGLGFLLKIYFTAHVIRHAVQKTPHLIGKSPLALAASRIAQLMSLFFLATFFRQWMNRAAMELLAREEGKIFTSLVYGYLAGVAFVVLFRGAAMILAPKTNPVWLDLMADPESKWAKLENWLLTIAFLLVLASAFASVIYPSFL